jgi:hypothetical protein
MKIQYLFYLIFLCGCPLFGQSIFDANSFLSTIKGAEQVNFQRDKSRYLAKMPHHLRRIEQVEIRTETNDFDWRKQEYLFRVSPNSRNHIKMHQRYYQTVQYMTEMELEQAIGTDIKVRYDLIVDYLFIQKLLDLKETMEVLYKDKVTLLNRSMTLPDFEVLDLIEAQDEKQQNEREILDLKNELLQTRQVIQRLKKANSDFVLKVDNLIPIAQLLQIVQQTKVENVATHPILKVQSAKLYNHMLEYEWEAAQSKFSLGYVQTKYSYDPENAFRETFSVGVGFVIPIKGAAQFQLNELLLDKLEAESEYRNLKSQLEIDKNNFFQQLEIRIQKYDLVKQQLEEGSAEFVIKEYGKIAEASPVALLKLRESTLNNQLLLIKLEWDIYQNYIACLDIVGLLHRLPLKNYLSKELSPY